MKPKGSSFSKGGCLRVVLLLALFAWGLVMAWGAWQQGNAPTVLVAGDEGGGNPSTRLADPNPVAQTTPQVADYVLLQDERVDATAERMALETEAERVRLELAGIQSQIEQADQQQQLGLLREQQRLELERQQIGNLIATWDAERARLVNDAQAQAQRIELVAAAEAQAVEKMAAADVAAAQAATAQAQAGQAQATATAVVWVVQVLAVAVVGVVVGLLLAWGVMGVYVQWHRTQAKVAAARILPPPRSLLLQVDPPTPPSDEVAEAFFEQAPPPTAEPVRDPHTAPPPRVITGITEGITRNYDLLREYFTPQEIGQIPDIRVEAVPEWAGAGMRRMVADGHSRTLVSAIFGLTGRNYGVFREILEGQAVAV